MSRLHIDLRDGRSRFAPGQTVSGAIAWSFDEPQTSLELRLRWITRGKGKEDSETVASLRIDAPSTEGVREFQFRIPESPWSFRGKLVTLAWSLLLSAGGTEIAREITVSPAQREIDLYQP